MLVATLNLNGLRSAAQKGFLTWAASSDIDVFLLQETRIQADQRADGFELPGYQSYFCDAQSKGYSGVAIYSRIKPTRVARGIDFPEFDAEGRWIEMHLPNVVLVSLYLPSGSSGEARQSFKFTCMEKLSPHFQKLRRARKPYLIAGDYNIAHREIDLKNWRGNRKNSGFLPAERAWMSELIETHGWVDSHRHLKPDVAEYTWWSNRANAYANDVGWRIDYQLVSPKLKDHLHAATVYKQQKFSDHAPLIVEYRGLDA
jgi:exodeoxyribonuclease-3